MIAAILEKPRLFTTKNTIDPEPNDDQVKVKLQGCGICASSIPVWEGREWFSYPLNPGAPGHEGWGIVESAGNNITSVTVGDRVAFLSGNSYAEYDIVNQDSIVKLPAVLRDRAFPGEPLGCAMNIFERSDILPGSTVAIIGIGFLGALLCQLAKHKGAKVIAISRREYSLEFARLYGADETISFTSIWEVKNKVAEITGQEMCRRVIEATGKQEALDVATEIVSEGGKMIIAGYHQDGLRQVNLQQWNWKGIDVINAHERRHSRYIQGMQLAIEAVAQGILTPESLYTHTLSLYEVNRGFGLTATRPNGFMKALVAM